MKLSVVLYMDRCEETARALSALKQNRSFEETQVIVVDPFCSEDSAAVLAPFAGCGNVEVLQLPETLMAVAYGAGLKKVDGDYVNFTLASSLLSKGTLDAVLKAAGKQNKVLLFNTAVQGISTVNDMVHPVNYKMQAGSEGLFNVREQPDRLNMILQSYFIETKLAKSLSFHPALGSTAINAYLLELLEQETMVYTLQKQLYTYYELLEFSANATELARDKDWYTDSLRNFYIPFVKRLTEENGTAPTYLQVATLYLIWAKYNCNYFDRDREVLNREEAFEFYDVTCEYLSYINDTVIFQNYPCKYTISRYLKLHYYLGKCKYLGTEPCSATVVEGGAFAHQLVLKDKNYEAYTKEQLNALENRKEFYDLCDLGLVENQNVNIRILDYIDGKIEMDFDFVSYLLDTSDYELYLKIGNDKNKVTAVPTEVYSFNKYFGITISRQKTYHVSIPVDVLMGKKLTFGYTLDGVDYEININFYKVYSRLSNSNASYWMLGKDKCLNVQGNSIVCTPINGGKRFLKEVKFFAYRFVSTPVTLSLRVKYLLLRLLYWIVHPFMKKKRIWLTFDKLYKAGDDGEYMFQYCMQQDDGIDIYYIVSPDSADYARLKAQHGKHVLKQNCLRLKLYALYAECILATHATVINYLGFTPKTNIFIRDLFHGVIVCIQHGLTIQKIAQYQNRWFDDTRLYTLASKYEKQNVETPIYDYFGPELKMTGLARYDGLKNNDQKQILITPTWRRNVVNQSIAFVKKTHNDSFKNSEYFRIYNSLINDQTLIDCAKKTGYKLIYLLHPAMSSQAEDFDRNDYVDIVQATGDMSYEKILTESSLMVTDYSGVQFDFAYQRKPLVYYHPDTLPPHYEAGGLIYETMGFGPICKNHEEVVSALCRYMENGCKMEEEYVKRADDFFYYDDFNSCERIYKEVTAFLADPNNF